MVISKSKYETPRLRALGTADEVYASDTSAAIRQAVQMLEQEARTAHSG